MKAIDRRRLLAAPALAVFAGASAAAAQPAPAQPQAAKPQPNVLERLTNLINQNAHPLGFDGQHFSGPGWELILAEARMAEFTLLGEEHGTHEIPIFARELFLALRPQGYDTLAVEISPPIAEDLDRAARGGVDGIAQFARDYPPGPAFYFWKTEADLIAAARAAVPGKRDVIWGLDYEVTGDRRLIARLKAKAPASAATAMAVLEAASTKAWATWRTTHNPGGLFTFAGDPALVRAVRDAWPRRDADVDRILDTLEETLEINRLYATKGYDSNLRRARFNRRNLAAHLKVAADQGRKPKVLFKMGETHLMRGVTTTGDFDVGSMAHEAAELRGGHAFSIIAGGGRGAVHGNLNPTDMSVADGPVDMLDDFMGLGFLTEAVKGPGPVVVDLRPLRPTVGSPTRLAALNNSEAVRAIFAYDVVIVWNGSTGARMLTETHA